VSRVQPLGLSRSDTSSAVVALPSCGGFGRLKSVGTIRQNAPAIDAAGQVHELQQLRGQERGTFDQLAVHIHDIEAAVRTVGELDGRNQMSFEARNSRSLSARAADQLSPFGSSFARYTRLFATSPTKTLPRYASGNASPR